MWIFILAAVIVGLLQPALLGLGSGYTFINLPSLLLMATLRTWSAKEVAVVALLIGLSWDWLSPPLGPAALAMIVAAAVVFYIERNFWPARGGWATGALVMIMALIIRVILLLLSGSWLWHINFLRLVTELLISGLVAAWWWRKVTVTQAYGR